LTTYPCYRPFPQHEPPPHPASDGFAAPQHVALETGDDCFPTENEEKTRSDDREPQEGQGGAVSLVALAAC